jgi:hypothetical protein
MLTLRDCLDMAGLDEAEVEAIVEHEHLPFIVALEFADFLLHEKDGLSEIRRIFRDDIAAARRHGDREHVLALAAALSRFMSEHAGAGKTTLR